MSVSAASLDKVSDRVSRMQALRALFNQATLALADNPDATLDAATVTAIKVRLKTSYDALSAEVKAEVTAGW